MEGYIDISVYIGLPRREAKSRIPVTERFRSGTEGVFRAKNKKTYILMEKCSINLFCINFSFFVDKPISEC